MTAAECPNLLIVGARVAGHRDPVDVRLAGGTVSAVGRLERRAGEERIEALGGALLPGLHDHHVHLLAMAARRWSVNCAPPSVVDRTSLGSVLSGARPGPDGWVRAVGYDESLSGRLDRHRLDQLVPDRPLRVQHRSGALWVLNSAGLDRVGPLPADGRVERDGEGAPTGRLLRLDDWLRRRLPTPGRRAVLAELAAVGAELAQAGVTGLTDATVDSGLDELGLLEEAAGRGLVPQRLTVMGPDGWVPPQDSGVALGPVKVVLSDDHLPTPTELADRLAAAHRQDRPVAIHCVTRAELVVALVALGEAGPRDGDRIEHGGVVPDELLGPLAAGGLTVVTQPGFVAARGDRYLAEVERADQPFLYRCRSLWAAGIKVAGSSDAPFGPSDPWLAIRTAIDRRTASGMVLGVDERLPPRQAIGLYLGPASDPGGPPRVIAPGAPADCCLLSLPPEGLGAETAQAEVVALTVVDGRVVVDRLR